MKIKNYRQQKINGIETPVYSNRYITTQTPQVIIKAEIIKEPYSGEFKERIYDNESPWNSQNWTWVKFKEDDANVWCGQFRGSPRKVSVSNIYGKGLILTSDYLFEIDLKTGDILNLEDQPQYHNLTTAPDGSFIIADYYNVERITSCLDNKELIKCPIRMDMIEFKEWKDDMLEFTCDEFLNWDKRRCLVMIYDNETNEIMIKK